MSKQNMHVHTVNTILANQNFVECVGPFLSRCSFCTCEVFWEKFSCIRHSKNRLSSRHGRESVPIPRLAQFHIQDLLAWTFHSVISIYTFSYARFDINWMEYFMKYPLCKMDEIPVIVIKKFRTTKWLFFPDAANLLVLTIL